MKHLNFIYKAKICLWLTVLSCACEPGHNDDITTSARVTLTAPDSIALFRAKGTVTMQCLTNKITWTASEWDSVRVAFPEVMRGPYNITADGKVAVSINGGRRKVYRFRAANSYVEVMKHPPEIKLDIQLVK
ncbi:hypothetical protein [Prevotella sp. OH937_COT-195]|uniref:hypothetical protein n=1 Tax=Prevotella sp. OH937_COT-195 TaxID=2491051 RepID=UPI000F6479AE|nr:hypothetical protein [Prevotella sp. OH937_COT-195]RRD00273.1 hypothetical protein EII32_07130 [Prevotella sp. OH937_COT-195]